MNAEAAIAIGLISSVIGILVLYLLIRYAVQHGVTAALRTHEMWMHDGSREVELNRHTAKTVESRPTVGADGKLDRPA